MQRECTERFPSVPPDIQLEAFPFQDEPVLVFVKRKNLMDTFAEDLTVPNSFPFAHSASVISCYAGDARIQVKKQSNLPHSPSN